MSEDQQSLAQVKEELLDKIGGVDRKVEAVDHKVEAVEQRLLDKIEDTRCELVNLVNATATGLERHMDKKLEQMEERMTKTAEAAADRAVSRVIGTVFERSAYDAAVFHDKVRSIESRLDEHISNENVHLAPGSPRR